MGKYKKIDLGSSDSEVLTPQVMPSWNEVVDNLTDTQLESLAASMSYFSARPEYDEDGFLVRSAKDLREIKNVSKIQRKCWELFEENPQINSHVRDFMGSLTGSGFKTTSTILEIREVIRLITNDIRNEFYKFLPKWVARSEIQGELFLALTVHSDGFVETDYMDSSTLSGGGDNGSGIYFHPTKGTWPVLYEFEMTNASGRIEKQLVPSIYCAYYPSIIDDVVKKHKLDKMKIYGKTGKSKFKEIGGFKSFIVAWDRGYLTKRNASHVKTTIEWIMHYVNLKKWEIDHKKSSGSYLWVVEVDNMQSFRMWLKMSDDERSKTGLSAKKVPGGQLILPPGFKMNCINPALASISEQDNDIMHMVTSGLNKPEDMVTGQTKGDTFSGIKASRGPQADRTKDDIEYFERFLRYDLWRSIFFLYSKMVPEFAMEYKIKKVIDFKKKKKVEKIITFEAFELVDFSFPQSEIMNLEAKTKALLGVNHQSIVEALGIPRAEVAKLLGFNSYASNRYLLEEEDDKFPVLPATQAVLAGISNKEFGNTQFKKNTLGNEDDQEDQEDDQTPDTIENEDKKQKKKVTKKKK